LFLQSATPYAVRIFPNVFFYLAALKLISAIDDVYIEAQQIGLSPTLCAANSSFISDYQSCESCVAANSNTTIIPEFEPFLDFCSAQVAQPEITTAQTPTVIVVATPEITTAQTPTVIVVATPEITTAPTPTVTVVVTPDTTKTVIPTPITSSANLEQSSSLASLLSQAKLSLLAEASSLGLDLGTTQRITSTVFYTPAATLSQNSSSTCEFSHLSVKLNCSSS
jgi:hypothetical protein